MYLYILSSAFLLIFFGLLIYTVRYSFFDWKKLAFAVFAALIFKTPIFVAPFFGLEYEDSYIFSVVARQFANNVFSNSYFTESIVLGSIEDPILYGTYSGHYILFSVFSSWIIRIVGFSPDLLSYINASITFLVLLILNDLSIHLKLNRKQWWIIPSIFLISPIVNVFGSTQLSETFSSFLILSFIYFLILFRNKQDFVLGISVIVSFILSILTKRENNFLILLIICFLVYDVLILKRYQLNKAYFLYLAIFIVFVFTNLFVEDLAHSIEVESNEIGSAAFSLEYFSRIFPVFIKSLFTFRYFVVIGLLLMFSIILGFVRKFPPIIYLCIILLLGYLVLYSIHYRSYYFIHYQSINEFDTFRYLNNIYPLLVIVIGYALSIAYNYSRVWKWSVIILLVTASSFSLKNTVSLRGNFSAEENNIRFQHPGRIIEYFENKEENYAILSGDALIFQILGPNDLYVCDVLDVNSALDRIPEDFEIYLHINPFLNSKHFHERYPEVSNWIENSLFEHELTLSNNSELLRLKNP